MRVVDIIARKRDGGALAPEDIAFLVDGYTAGRVPDYQIAAFLMAVVLRGMTREETAALTGCMLRSGAVLDLSALGRPVADKHSTGGIGDKTSLLVAPIAAAAGLAVPMISGRALGHTSGTLDKLESIPGFRTDLTLAEFRGVLESHGASLIGQTAEIAPADRLLYALRDATATVPSIPLIVASIMSKKLAEGLDVLVLDVKAGSGAFMKGAAEARQLALAMCEVGEAHGTRVTALLTRMDEPLGRAVGNAVEVAECVEALRGCGPRDLVALSTELAAHMIALAGAGEGLDAARRAARRQLDSGAALEVFRRVVEAQGGDPRVVDDATLLPRAPVERAATAPRGGYVRAVDGEAVGWAVMAMGAGRADVSAAIDRGVGLVAEARIGEEVREGDALCRVFARDAASAELAAARVSAAYEIGDERPDPAPLVLETVSGRSHV
jgi:pyrimidine-nucleoside phosphorylase/thymidine phosphorylase